MIRDKTHSQVIMLTSGTIHAFIIEIQQGIKASKDLSRSLKVVTWLWRTRKRFIYTAFESRKGNLRRAFVISIQPFLFKSLFASFLSFSHYFLFLLMQGKQVFFIIFHTRATIPPIPYFSYHNEPFSPTSTMLYTLAKMLFRRLKFGFMFQQLKKKIS